MLSDIADVVPFLQGDRPSEKALNIYVLLKKHTQQVKHAISRIQSGRRKKQL